MADPRSDEQLYLDRWTRVVPGACLYTCPVCGEEIIISVPIKAKLAKTPDGGAEISFVVVRDGSINTALLDHQKEKRHGE